VEAERRQVTVLFADMVGFTVFSERAGEEAAYSLMRRLAKLLEDTVREHGGAVQGFTGDGVLAVFGAPVAYEDAPVRACRAALQIFERLGAAWNELEAKFKLRPQLRIGINSGPAVIGQVQSQAEAGVTVMGDTVNVAARLQALAEPGTAVLAESTFRLAQGLIDASLCAERDVKGKAELQRIYRLESIRKGTNVFEARLVRGLTAYVGRDRELETLERALDGVANGPKVIDVVGEPGIGKSRLLYEFRRQAVADRIGVLSGSFTLDGQQTPFQAFVEMIREAFGVSLGEPAAGVAKKLAQGLQTSSLESEENLGLMMSLLGLEPPGSVLEGFDGALIGIRTHDLLRRLIEARCKPTPLVLQVEDLHWIDSASEDLLSKLIAIEGPAQLLIVHTRRPEYRPPWTGQPKVSTLVLEPLTARETARIAQARLGIERLPKELAELVSAKAEGNALFAEEIVNFLVEKSLLRLGEAGPTFDTQAIAAAVPDTIQSLFASRLDGLSASECDLMQLCAVIGRRFDADLVAAIRNDRDEVATSLATLEARDFLLRDGPADEYAFKHAISRDVLYSRMLSGFRAGLHLQVAEEMERRGGNRLSEIVDTLAHHFDAAGHNEKAFRYLVMAGEKSLDVYALPEAEQYFRKALEIWKADQQSVPLDSVMHLVAKLVGTLHYEAKLSDVLALCEDCR
jgi:class 3 adenylate cyclase